MKAKKGQILVLVLILMAVGLIVISPLLRYLNTSYNLYLSKLNDTGAYLTIDAMIGKIFSDMYAGENVYILNTSEPGRYSPTDEWLNGYKISTSINNSIANPPPPSSGSSEEEGWTYTDPGCAFGLNTLAHDATYPFKVYLTEGTNITTNWYFKDSKTTSCNYYCIGRMWITNSSGTVCGSADNDLNTAANTPFQQQLSWTVPQGGSGNYSINFQNRAVRCTTPRSMSEMMVKPTFSGIGDPLYTWVMLGDSSGDLYQDYTITTTARLRDTNIVSVTACVRQTPGPLIWKDHQSLAVVSWVITYY